jgi:hypothetical protein
MKRMRLVLFIGITAVGIVTLSTIVARATGCLQVPGPRCTNLTCSDTGGASCNKYCTADPTIGFGSCLNQGGSEEYCTDFTGSVGVTHWEGTCDVFLNCTYGDGQSEVSFGAWSQDTSPCPGS